MKKFLSILLSLVLLIGCLPLKVTATTDSPSSTMELFCPECSKKGETKNTGELMRQWWEFGYYFDRLWNQFKCYTCDHVWATCILEVSHPYNGCPDEDQTEMIVPELETDHFHLDHLS